MSLEQAIKDNTDAVKALTAALAAQIAPAKPPKASKEEKAPAAAAAEKPAAAETAKPAEAKVEVKSESKTPEGVTYEDVSTVTANLIEMKGKGVTKEVLGTFKVTTAKNLEASQWADYVAAAKAAMAAPADEELA